MRTVASPSRLAMGVIRRSTRAPSARSYVCGTREAGSPRVSVEKSVGCVFISRFSFCGSTGDLRPFRPADARPVRLLQGKWCPLASGNDFEHFRRMSADVSEVLRPLDAAVKEALVENHREFLLFLERRLGRRDVAEDILQEAFARGLEKLDSLREGEGAVPWFYRALRNATIDYYRRTQAADRALAQFAKE